MIAANEQVAGLLESRRVPALYRVHEPPEATAVRAADRPARVAGGADAAGPARRITPQQAAELVGEVSQLLDAGSRARGRGRRALTSLVLRSLKQAYYDQRNRRARRAAARPLLPFHLADPPLSGPDLPPGAAVGDGGDEPAPEASWVADGRAVGLGARARGDDDRARRRRRRALLPARARAVRGRIVEATFDGEVVGLIGAGAFVAFGPRGGVRGHAPGAADARRLVGAERGGDDAGRHAQRRRAAARRPRARACRRGSTRRAGRVDLLPALERRSD